MHRRRCKAQLPSTGRHVCESLIINYHNVRPYVRRHVKLRKEVAPMKFLMNKKDDKVIAPKGSAICFFGGCMMFFVVIDR